MEYVHGFSEEEQARLVAQATLWKDRLITPGLPYRAGEHLLEIGCGVGAVLGVLTDAFEGLRVAGIDLEPAQIGAAKKHLEGRRADLRVGDARALPWDDACFDHVYAMWMLEHVNDPAPFLNEARRVLRPDGSITLHETDYAMFHTWPRSEDHDYLAEGQRLLFRASGNAFVGRRLGASLVGAGFREVESRPMGFHFFTGDPDLPVFTEYLLGFLEPMIPRMVALGLDEARLRAGADHLRGLDTLAEASLTQIVFRATARR